MCCILAALPDLEAVDVELWREWTIFEQQMADRGEYFRHSAPSDGGCIGNASC
jgi:hypothetical protein